MDAIHQLNAITLPTTSGAPGTPVLPVHVVQALVLELIQSDVFRLQLPQAVVDVRTNVPLAPGSIITVVPKSTGTGTRLVIYSEAPQLAAASSSGDVAPSLAGKHPIGEATVIGRAPSVAAKISAEPAPVDDAPPVSPARPPEAPAPRSVTPQLALGEAVRVAAARQTGLAPLFADVEQVVLAPPGTVPPPVREAAQQVLALRVPLDAKLIAPDLKQAFVRSGVLFEPRLAAEARGMPLPNAQPPQTLAAALMPAGDLKAALIVFREVLKAWAGDTAPVRVAQSPSAPVPDAIRPALSDANMRLLANALAGQSQMLSDGAPLSPEQATSLAKNAAAVPTGREGAEHASPVNPNGPPPPYRGAPLAAQQPAPATIAFNTPPHETAERLLAATDGAIARTTLMQAASLPDQPGAQRSDPAAQRWTFEVPFATPQGTGIAQFEVSRDGHESQHEERAAIWRARFSLDLEPMGPVHALVALSGERASVLIWAERPATATRLNEHAAMLSDALRAAELEPADFQFRVGAPPAAARQPPPGRFMDRAT